MARLSGPDLGPSPAEDGIPALDETYKWVTADGLHVTGGIIHEQDPERGRRLNERQAAAVYELLRWHHNTQKRSRRVPGARDSKV